MYSGLYNAATGMLVQQLRHEVTSQNLANVNTPGYKQQQTVLSPFADVLLHTITDNKQAVPVGTTNRGVQIEDIDVDWDQGGFEATNKPEDLALEGKGFFTISTPEGIRYTRNGHFELDEEGFLVSSPGNYLMGERAPIWVGGKDFEIDAEGNVIQQGDIVDRLYLPAFNSEELRSAGDGFFEAKPEAVGRPSEAGVRQGFLEKSNLDPVRQLVTMLEAARAYETNQRVVQVYDQLLNKGANEIGLLR